jgi:hypothetical protein
MQITLSTYAVRSTDGSIDTQATLDKFASDLDQFARVQAADQERVAEAVHAVFDSHKGTRINMPYLVSQALPLLQVTPATHKALSERVLAYVRENADGKGANLFSIEKGKGGGCARIADLPPAESK